MEKIGKFIKSNIKLVIGIIIGSVISGTTVYAATILFASNQVSYDNTTSGMNATNVQDALDELYTKANTWIDPSTIETDSTGKIFASSRGIIIRRNGQTHLIRNDNWAEEQNHIQQIFSDVGAYNSSTGLGCTVNSYYVRCNASEFYCTVDSDGNVSCYDLSDDSLCYVRTDGSVDCYSY